MPDITTTIPRAALKSLLNYAWEDEEADYAAAHGIDPVHVGEVNAAVEHARTNHASNHIFADMVRVADWLESIKLRVAIDPETEAIVRELASDGVLAAPAEIAP